MVVAYQNVILKNKKTCAVSDLNFFSNQTCNLILPVDNLIHRTGDRKNQFVERFHYLDNCRVSKCLVEDVQLAAELNGVDDEVLLSGRDLHQAGEAEETPVGVVLRWRTEF